MVCPAPVARALKGSRPLYHFLTHTKSAQPCFAQIQAPTYTRLLCRLMTDSAFCLDLMSRVCKAGFAIEEALGSAQDVEGAIEENGEITVVQTRPQM